MRRWRQSDSNMVTCLEWVLMASVAAFQSSSCVRMLPFEVVLRLPDHYRYHRWVAWADQSVAAECKCLLVAEIWFADFHSQLISEHSFENKIFASNCSVPSNYWSTFCPSYRYIDTSRECICLQIDDRSAKESQHWRHFQLCSSRKANFSPTSQPEL